MRSASMSVAHGQEPIPLLVPDAPAPEALLPYLQRMHAARHYSNFGPLVCELEAQLAQRFALPIEAVTTVANATLGLELVLQALELPVGSRVLLPTLTFVATATAVLRAGLVPVLSDVDARTWQLTPAIAIQACKRERIDVVLPVATFGMPHDMAQWQRFEEATGLPVVVDAAAAYGSQWLQGAHGTLVFSLHATKSLPAGEGGVVVSTRANLAAKVRQLSNFGINLDPAIALPVGALSAVGTNAKMSELHAAMGLAALQVWEQGAAQRRAVFERLRQALDDVGKGRLGWQASPKLGAEPLAPTSLCLTLPGAHQRDRLEALCVLAGIGTRRWYQPLLHRMEALAPRCIVLAGETAEALAHRLIGLPFFPSMTPAQQQRIVQVVEQALLSK